MYSYFASMVEFQSYRFRGLFIASANPRAPRSESWKPMLKKTIARWNDEYYGILRAAQKRLLGERVMRGNRKGRVQSVQINEKGVIVTIKFDDGHIEQNVGALDPEYDP